MQCAHALLDRSAAPRAPDLQRLSAPRRRLARDRDDLRTRTRLADRARARLPRRRRRGRGPRCGGDARAGRGTRTCAAGDLGYAARVSPGTLPPAASRVERLRRETPSQLIAFDVLAAGGVDLQSQPFSARRRAL